MKVLHITSSARGNASYSNRVASALLAEIAARNPGSPVVVVDAAHNPAGMAVTVDAVRESFGGAEVIAVLAVSADKDVTGILDELEPLARLAEHRAVNVVRDRRHQDVGGFDRLDKLAMRQRLVVGVQPRVEQFAHAHFDAVGQPTGDHDQGLLARRHALPLRQMVPMTRKFSPAILRFATTVCASPRRSGLLNPARRN